MLSDHRHLLYLMIYVVSVIVGSEENTACRPNKLILLSNCSFNYPYSNRTLSMTVPYSLDANEDENLSIKVLTRHRLEKSLIHFNLNLIQCSINRFFRWTSVESSSTLRGEFVRTSLINPNIMYLSSGLTYLRNLTTIDCSTKTMYQTQSSELFQINLKIESTLNDYCSDEEFCYPLNIYYCNSERQRCACRSPLQSFLTKDQHAICVHAVQNLTQCTIDNVRCLEWCHANSSSTMCICPKDVTKKRSSNDHRGNDHTYCEGRTSEVCNSFIQCPLGDLCLHGICRSTDYSLEKFLSVDLVTISIVVSAIILLGIILILSISICILRRQRWKNRYHSSIDTVCRKKQQQQHHHQQQQQPNHVPTTSDYDNIIYGVFRQNVHLSSHDESGNDSSLFNTSDSSSSSYHPKIVFLGGEEQLTAIYA